MNSNWNTIIELAKTNPKPFLETLSCPACGGQLVFRWVPGWHGSLAVECVSCEEGLRKITNDRPAWASATTTTEFKSHRSN